MSDELLSGLLNPIHHGDCIIGMTTMPEGSVDLAVADPPFNIGYDYDVYEDARGMINSIGRELGLARSIVPSNPTARSVDRRVSHRSSLHRRGVGGGDDITPAIRSD